MPPPVSVVICAYTEARLDVMTSTVAAARAQLGRDDELLVVIDHNERLLGLARARFGGEPGTGGEPGADAEAGADLAGAPVRVLSSPNAPGLSGARNAGVEASRGEVIAFLDDDAVPRDGWLRELVSPFADSSVLGVGGLVAAACEVRPPAWLPDEFLWVVGCSYRGLPERQAEIRNPIGANMAFRRDAFVAAGGFTEGIGRLGSLPVGCEETEFAIRATAATGRRVVQQPAARVDHLVPAERTRLRYFVRRCWGEGISKAAVARIVGGGPALASERAYVTHTLLSGVLRGVGDGLRGRPAGFARAAAIIGGLTLTSAGYLYGQGARYGQAAQYGQAHGTDRRTVRPECAAAEPGSGSL